MITSIIDQIDRPFNFKLDYTFTEPTYESRRIEGGRVAVVEGRVHQARGSITAYMAPKN